jgi:hypothetical protein
MSTGKKLAKSGHMSSKDARKAIANAERKIRKRGEEHVSSVSRPLANAIRDKINKKGFDKARVVTVLDSKRNTVYFVYIKGK